MYSQTVNYVNVAAELSISLYRYIQTVSVAMSPVNIVL